MSHRGGRVSTLSSQQRRRRGGKKPCPQGLSCPYRHEHQHVQEYDHAVPSPPRGGGAFAGRGRVLGGSSAGAPGPSREWKRREFALKAVGRSREGGEEEGESERRKEEKSRIREGMMRLKEEKKRRREEAGEGESKNESEAASQGKDGEEESNRGEEEKRRIREEMQRLKEGSKRKREKEEVMPDTKNGILEGLGRTTLNGDVKQTSKWNEAKLLPDDVVDLTLDDD